MKGHGHWRRTPALSGSLSDGLESGRPHRTPQRPPRNRVPRVSGQPGVAQIDKAAMTHREYGDRTSFVTATGAISGAEIFFGDIEDEHDRRETSIRNLAKWADEAQRQAVKRGRFFRGERLPIPQKRRLGRCFRLIHFGFGARLGFKFPLGRAIVGRTAACDAIMRCWPDQRFGGLDGTL